MATEFDLNAELNGSFVTVSFRPSIVLNDVNSLRQLLQKVAAQARRVMGGDGNIISETDGDCIYASVPVSRIVHSLSEVVAALRVLAYEQLERQPKQVFRMNVQDCLVR